MASDSQEAKQERADALSLFRSGQTKAEIARHFNKDRKAVSQMIAKAIKEQANGPH